MIETAHIQLFRSLFRGRDDVSRRITALLKQELIRKIAPRIYASNLSEEPSAIIKRNWYRILAHLYPNAIVSHRSALEFKPTPGGHILTLILKTSICQD